MPHPRDPEIYPGDLDPIPEDPRVGEIWTLKGSEQEALVIEHDPEDGTVVIAPMGGSVQTIAVAELQEHFIYSGESSPDEVQSVRETATWDEL